MYKRWYDIDPTVSLAVSLMRNANIITQYKCAELIVNKSKENGIDLSGSILAEAFNFVLRRWYDNDQKIAESFEYLKLMPEALQKETANDLIEFLQAEEVK
ncbi:MAG: hypothetical protein MJ237_02960 [bacterium]|nr:hypothetical protein [bacterium]